MSRPSKSNRRILASFGAALALFAAAPAQAYPEFPGVLQEELNLKCLPSCLTCHTRAEGGKGYLKDGAASPLPANQGYGSFISNLEAAGMGVPKEDNLPAFIAAFQAVICGGPANTMNTQGLTKCDSDGDGRTDVQELQEGTDPDTKDVKGPYSCLVPEYGCGASIAPLPRDESATGRAVALVAALGVGLTLARRFRR